MPPATLGTVLTPSLPEVMPKPHLKPASSVVGPTSRLNEKVAPGATTVPFSRSAASLMLARFSGIAPPSAVEPLSISSSGPSAAGSLPTTGSTGLSGRGRARPAGQGVLPEGGEGAPPGGARAGGGPGGRLGLPPGPPRRGPPRARAG